ncbi:MAG: NAD-dependent epimerase/dehydratase family protein, partial [Candidatus Bathyarchaeia archaeon]
MIKICVAGAAGRMGSTLIKEAVARGYTVVGAVEGKGNPNVGKTLREAGICNSDVKIVDPSHLEDAAKEADVYISFTTPEAEVENLPIVAN